MVPSVAVWPTTPNAILHMHTYIQYIHGLIDVTHMERSIGRRQPDPCLCWSYHHHLFSLSLMLVGNSRETHHRQQPPFNKDTKIGVPAKYSETIAIERYHIILCVYQAQVPFQRKNLFF